MNAEIVKRVLEVVDAGLCCGKGKPTPGQMCVEAAVCYAVGEPHGDKPSCVSSSVRAYKIGINDSPWSSFSKRAKGMRRIAIAQLGSVYEINREEFARKICIAVCREVLPPLLDTLGLDSTEFRQAGTIEDVKRVSMKESSIRATELLNSMCSLQSAVNSSWCDHSASRSADLVRWTASAMGDLQKSIRVVDNILIKAAEIGVAVLQECGSPGCEYLYLCEETDDIE